MSIGVLTEIWRKPPCKGGDLLCLLAIADNADDEGYAWPSMKSIARKAAMSERGAQKCVKKLSDMGLIRIDVGGGRNKTNGYQITTNGIGEDPEYTNPEQNTPNGGSPFTPINPEQTRINPEQSNAKPRTPVHPNHQEPSSEPSLPPKSPEQILCEVVRPETARDFAEHRKQLRKPLTVGAAERLVKRVADHPDPDAVFDLSIENGWQGVFPENASLPNSQSRGGHQSAKPSKQDERMRAFIAGARGTP